MNVLWSQDLSIKVCCVAWRLLGSWGIGRVPILLLGYYEYLESDNCSYKSLRVLGESPHMQENY